MNSNGARGESKNEENEAVGGDEEDDYAFEQDVQLSYDPDIIAIEERIAWVTRVFGAGSERLCGGG